MLTHRNPPFPPFLAYGLKKRVTDDLSAFSSRSLAKKVAVSSRKNANPFYSFYDASNLLKIVAIALKMSFKMDQKWQKRGALEEGWWSWAGSLGLFLVHEKFEKGYAQFYF